MNKNSRTSFIIGEEFVSGYGDKYKIVGYTGSSRERAIEFESGYVKTVLTSSLRQNKIRDANKNTYYGVACLGMEKAIKHYLYLRWYNMIGRCYNVGHCQYKSYGDKGVYVEKYLRNFKNYVEFVETLPNIERLKSEPNKWHIDKDLKGGKCYSRETLTIIKAEDNIELENKAKRIKIIQLSLDNKILNKFNSITEAEMITGIHVGNIARAVRKDGNTAGGYRWIADNKEGFDV